MDIEKELNDVLQKEILIELLLQENITLQDNELDKLLLTSKNNGLDAFLIYKIKKIHDSQQTIS